jgi:hypothetical protein
MEDAATIHFRNHLSYGGWSFCYYRQFQVGERFITSCSYAADGDSFHPHGSRQRRFQIRKQTRP